MRSDPEEARKARIEDTSGYAAGEVREEESWATRIERMEQSQKRLQALL